MKQKGKSDACIMWILQRVAKLFLYATVQTDVGRVSRLQSSWMYRGQQ